VQTAVSGAQVLSSLDRDYVGVKDARGGEPSEPEERGLDEKTRSPHGDLADELPEIRAGLRFPVELVRVRVPPEGTLQGGPRQLLHQPQTGTTENEATRVFVELVMKRTDTCISILWRTVPIDSASHECSINDKMTFRPFSITFAYDSFGCTFIPGVVPCLHALCTIIIAIIL